MQWNQILWWQQCYVDNPQIDLDTVKDMYLEKYDVTLKDALDSECSGDFKRLLIEILHWKSPPSSYRPNLTNMTQSLLCTHSLLPPPLLYPPFTSFIHSLCEHVSIHHPSHILERVSPLWSMDQKPTLYCIIFTNSILYFTVLYTR